MGNWRRAMIEGCCDPDEVDALAYRLAAPFGHDHFGPLSTTRSLCGLPPWAGGMIKAVGNLAERDYSEWDVADQLRHLAEVAPSLFVDVHLGGDWEAGECIATVTLRAGVAEVVEPAIETVPEIPQGQMTRAFIGCLTGGR